MLRFCCEFHINAKKYDASKASNRKLKNHELTLLFKSNKWNLLKLLKLIINLKCIVLIYIYTEYNLLLCLSVLNTFVKYLLLQYWNILCQSVTMCKCIQLQGIIN